MSEVILDMRSAFDIFWGKLNAHYEKEYNTKPTVCYTKKLNPDLFLQIYSESENKFIPCMKNASGYIQWQPKLQIETVDFYTIENGVGFKLSKELKDYYSSYLFLSLSGGFARNYFDFDPIRHTSEIVELALFQYEQAKTPFPKSQIFCLGDATIEKNDNYSVYYDNSSGKIFCRDFECNIVASFRNSLTQTIADMEPFG